jgi:FMN phosphatase YigB (HAD superfamily)
MVKALLFDLDGTVLDLEQDYFSKLYFDALCKYLNVADPTQFVKDLRGSITQMVNDDRAILNIDKFFSYFLPKVGLERKDIFDKLTAFYKSEFSVASKAAKFKPEIIQALEIAKEKGYELILATNPFFPLVAIKERLKWAHVDPNIFKHITSYENSSYCKPNPKYFLEILNRNNLKIGEVLMFGNDPYEDGTSTVLNIPFYLLTDDVVERDNPYQPNYQGNSAELLEFIKGLPVKRNIKKI